LIQKYLKRDRITLQKQLPEGTELNARNDWPIVIYRSDLVSDDEKRAWIMKTLNEFVSVLRPT
jgi:hypothetical protein